jgi:hypothetical protein
LAHILDGFAVSSYEFLNCVERANEQSANTKDEPLARDFLTGREDA